jgi:hypothetical protein
LYRTLIVALGSVVVVILRGGRTVNDSAWLIVAGGVVESVTLTVMLVGPPDVVGVPLITPVAVLNDSPVGSNPAVIEYEYGSTPPLTPTVWLYGKLAVASESVAVVKPRGGCTVNVRT